MSTRALRQAIDAAIKDTRLDEYAENRKELKASLYNWEDKII